MTQELTKAYDPSLVEDRVYAEWLKNHSFSAHPEKAFNGKGLDESAKAAQRQKGLKEAFCIVIPPPNVTGVLTMGHVLNNTIQDILARRKRMQGYEVLWLPGIDHAGIATQTAVERFIRKEEKKTRHDFSREEFVQKIWEWKDKHGGIILQQLKKLGASCDWSRTVFTMDGLDARDPHPRINYSKWVTWVFVKLYEKGLIYRGRRMVNWCVVSRTALSDEEVNMKEVRGKLWHIRYPIVGESHQSIIVATTRPETMLGDTAVAVNPKDERYQSLIGKKLLLPLMNREIPIIADDLVDPKFGTGCVKVTPAHDPADFEMGQRHHLQQIQVIGYDGKMTSEAGSNYKGMDRNDCRTQVISDLEEKGFLEKIEDYTHNVGYSERADVPVEPLLSDQWFLKYPAVKESLDGVLSRQIAYWPDRWTKVYEHWLTDIRDWCISRQLWWGHRIPVWTRNLNGTTETYVGMEAPQGDGWTQDPDVLDTWFSSWLWPFATMIDDPDHLPSEIRNPQSTIAKFYPTSDLVTGPDIIFFWVARMIIAGYEFMGDKPFSNVYFTGIVRDKQGRKMSKSLGNSPDPLDLISKYGADGLRFGMMRCAPLGLDIRFDEQQVELGRNFCNKLWNATRLRLSQTAFPIHQPEDLLKLKSEELSSDDKNILLQLEAAITEINRSFDGYDFNQITNKLYEFFWTHYCDWYLEASKAALYGTHEHAKEVTCKVMDYVLHHLLRLLHPFMPFITEELWQSAGFNRSASSIQFTPWPSEFTAEQKKQLGLEASTLAFVEQKYATVTAGRNLRASYHIPGSRKTRFFISPSGNWSNQPHEWNVLKILLNAETLEPASGNTQGAASAVTPLGTIYLPLEGLIDVEAETKRLQTQIAKLEKELQTVSSKLADPGFTSRAPAEKIEQHRTREREIKTDIEKIREQIKGLTAA